jgi:prophage antirepressor-like protein
MKLTTFDFQENPVRVHLHNDMPWFVAADVCRVLGLDQVTNAVRELDEDEKITLYNDKGNPRAGIPHQLRLISESGLYHLAFKSRKQEAKTFRKWVTSEVLPEIRKSGAYSPPLGPAETMSVLRFIREIGAEWSVQRQMEYGNLLRRYAKAMGVVSQTGVEPGVGRVFVYARPLLQEVVAGFTRQECLPDEESQEMERLLQSLHDLHGDTILRAEVVRQHARGMKLFSRVWKLKSQPAQHSAFGCVVARHAGRVFPNGLMIENRRTNMTREYEIRMADESTALSA